MNVAKRWITKEDEWLEYTSAFSSASSERKADKRDHTPWRPNIKSPDELAEMIPRLLDTAEGNSEHESVFELSRCLLDTLDHLGYVAEEPEPEVPSVLFGFIVKYTSTGILIGSHESYDTIPLELLNMLVSIPQGLSKFEYDGFLFTSDHLRGLPTEYGIHNDGEYLDNIPLVAMIAKCEEIKDKDTNDV